jgi:hypothetical protein
MNSRIPGPLGRTYGHFAYGLSDGTLARTVSPTPGPAGATPLQTGNTATPAPPAPGKGAAQITIELPLDVYLVNLQIVQETIEPYEVTVVKEKVKEKQTLRRKVRKVVETVASGQTEETIRATIERANEIWKAAGISFRLAKYVSRDVEFDSKVVTREGFLPLVAALKLPKTGLSMMFVRKFESPHLGGQSVDELGAGIISSVANPTQGNVLAHELGHLLGLGDLEHVQGSIENRYNLMYQALSAGYRLTPDQIKTALAKARIKAG